MLVSIAAEVGGHVSSVSKRIQLMAQGMKRSVNPTTKFRGNLEIGTDGFGIPVYCYLKTKPVTLATLAKESQASYEKETAGRVRMDRRYMNPRDPDEEVPPDHQVRAYRYGKEKVPFSSADVEFFKFQTEKSLKVLGFLDRSLVSPTKFMEPTDMFIAEPGKPHAAEALAALIEAMVSMNQVAIARFVARKNAAPKVVVLIPNSPSNGEEKYYAFWSNVLPFEEDVRNYEFAPLKTRQFTPNAEQQALADKLVDSLSVRDDKADEVGSCFNPVAHRFFNAVSTRAFDDGAPIPPIPADIEASINMDPVRKQQIEPLIRGFGDAFSLREAVKVKSNRKKKAFWSDVSTSLSETVKQEAASKDDGDHDDNEDAADGGASDGELDLDDLLDGSSGVTTVGSMNPVADFEALIDVSSVKRHDRLERLKAAVGGMKTQIESFLGQRDGQFHRKGLQCLAHFRKCSVNIHYAVEFNEFLVALKGSLCEESDAWDAVKREGVTLLSSDDDPSVGVTPAHARAFLYGEEDEDADAAAAAAAASLSLQVETMEQEDDMFADFE
jgi:ATP-dependent DNA helicase 2 subunit 2